ncbi:DUF4386 domain-containing protein [Actinomycetospora endophytica]|uniref:DUF4386 domain-containing protein n=1 Tax=Actinomycetospora endophytica TaxID=2291215 RepID=A0ABS8PER7_9PSEU|nr:DUF4386 family protein [Actinomycetospora endophytica]MCD2196754.1 DUF4386 domain-containing protein [Actinomycetospora endophytica]
MTSRTTAAAMIVAAALVNIAFAVLGAVFDYPDVLGHPPAEVLATFGAAEVTVAGWFAVLALGAALQAPIAIGVGRLSDARAMRWAVPVGIAAAVVQVIGLLRWPLLVPGWAAAAAGGDPSAVDSFATANRVLGTIVGETGGYVLTAGWTALVLVALGGRFAGRAFTVLGAVAAALILLGVLSPLDFPLVDLANFAGYVLWSVWLVVFAGILLIRARRQTSSSARVRATSTS